MATITRKAITPAQCRAARAFAGVTREELAELSGVSLSAVANFECSRTRMSRFGMNAIIEAFDEMGVTFDANPDDRAISVKLAAA